MIPEETLKAIKEQGHKTDDLDREVIARKYNPELREIDELWAKIEQEEE